MFLNTSGRIVSSALALALVVATTGVAQAEPGRGHRDRGYNHAPQHHSQGHRRSNTGRNIGIGIAAGVLGAIILNQAANASERGRGASHDDEGGLSCRQLDARCDDGQDWACRKFARRCE